MDHQILHSYNQTHYQEESDEPIDQEIKDLYDLTSPSNLEEIDIDDAWSRFSKTIATAEKEPTTRVVDFRPLLKIAAVLILSIGIGFFTYDFVDTESQKASVALVQLETGNDTKFVDLPDGTRVWMNKSSSLTYPEVFEGDRAIQFRGEGYFEVAKNNTRFVITTPETRVEVLGTAFNLNTIDPSSTKVTVTEGVVAFGASGRSTKIIAGHEGVFTRKTKEITLNQNPDVNATSWKTGHFVFDNTELSKVVDYLNGYYKKEIKIDARLSSCKVTGTFTKQPLTEVLQEISFILSAEVTNKGESFLISGEGC